jgi:hypothetical protein
MEACVVPTVLYLVFSKMFSLWWGIGASFAWTSALLLIHRHRGTASSHLVISLGFSSLRFVSALLLSSPALWAFFGIAQTAFVGASVATFAAVGKVHLIERVTHDLAPILRSYLGATTGRLTQSLAVLWGVQQMLLAALNTALLATIPIETYLAIRPFLGFVLAAPLLAIATVLLRRHRRSVLRDTPSGLIPAGCCD